MKMRYFSSVQGKAFLRPGRPGIYLGCKRKPRNAQGYSGGFVWNTDAIVAVVESEYTANLKDWNDAVRDKVLVERTQSDFDAAVKKRAADDKKAAQKRADDIEEAEKVAKSVAKKAAKAAAKNAGSSNTPDDEEG